jgi:hypothetical protein
MMNHNATRHHTGNCTNSLALSVGTSLFLQKNKSVMVNTRRANPGQNNTHVEEGSPGPEAKIANLNRQLAQTQKNVEDLLAQNALLQAARTPAPSQHLEGGEN